MIQGIGIDLVELDRIETLMERQPAFPTRILTEREMTRFLALSDHRKIEFLAGRFSAKEAFSKALGTGIGAGMSFLDIEILPNEMNKPIVYTDLFQGNIHVTISHSKEYAMAQIILEK